MELKLVFCDRAEFHEIYRICKEFNIPKYKYDRLVNAYLKAYVTGIIDNYKYIEGKILYDDSIDYNGTYNDLVEDLYELKHKKNVEYSDIKY